MSNQRRKNRELNLLSAYLDQALPERQKRQLEARLAVEPELRKKLENLQGTKLALSRLARLKAPRNFTLTPDMVPIRTSSRQPFQMGLRLASALAAVLLVVLFGAEFILGQIPQPAMLAAEAPAMEAARAPEEDAEAEPEPLIQWGSPNAGGKGGGVGGNSAAMEEPMLEMEALPGDEASPEMEAPLEEPPLEEPPLEEAQPEIQPEILAEQEAAAEMPAEGGDLILGINPDQGGEIIASSPPADASSEIIALPWSAFLHWVQIALAVIAVGGGLALLVLRLSKRTK